MAPITIVNVLANKNNYQRSKDLLLSVVKFVDDPKIKNNPIGSSQNELVVLKKYIYELINQNDKSYADRLGNLELSIEELVSVASRLNELEKLKDKSYKVTGLMTNLN